MPADATLQAIGAAVRSQPAGARRSALVVGCTGRLGEALLNAVLGSSAYDRVYARTRLPLASAYRKLAAADVQHPLPAHDDVYALVAGAAHELSAASYFGRDDAFVELPSAELPLLAAAARAAGARKFALLSPLAAYLQSSAFDEAAIDDAELAVLQAGFDAVAVLRPTAAGGAAPPAHGFMQRVMALWFAQLAYMVPGRLQPVRAARVAAAAVGTLTALDAGRRIVTAQDLHDASRFDAKGAGAV